MSIRELEPDLAGKGLRVGVVQSRFNEDIGEGLRSGCLAELTRLGVADTDITFATVPGALELPLADVAELIRRVEMVGAAAAVVHPRFLSQRAFHAGMALQSQASLTIRAWPPMLPMAVAPRLAGSALVAEPRPR